MSVLSGLILEKIYELFVGTNETGVRKEKPFILLFELLIYKKEHCTVLIVFINRADKVFWPP